MNTSSWNFPNMINVAQNKVGVAYDSNAIKNRVSLLLMTQPSELYGDLDFGAGLKQFMWQYNNANTRAMIKEKIVEQIRKYEPCVDPNSISFVDEDDISSESNAIVSIQQEHNKLHLTVIMKTIFSNNIEVSI